MRHVPCPRQVGGIIKFVPNIVSRFSHQCLPNFHLIINVEETFSLSRTLHDLVHIKSLTVPIQFTVFFRFLDAPFHEERTNTVNTNWQPSLTIYQNLRTQNYARRHQAYYYYETPNFSLRCQPGLLFSLMTIFICRIFHVFYKSGQIPNLYMYRSGNFNISFRKKNKNICQPSLPNTAILIAFYYENGVDFALNTRRP